MGYTSRILSKELNMKFAYYYNRINDWWVDKILDVETNKCMISEEHDNVMNFMYEPITYHDLKYVFKEQVFKDDDHLIDFGCGKGRVLVMAAKYGCKNLYGLDINEALIETAKNNMLSCSKRYGQLNYSLLSMNAKVYQFDSKINKVFFYNPFQLKIFIYVFKSLMRSLEEVPRDMMVFFCGARDSTIDYFEKLGGFDLVQSDEKKRIYVYEFKKEGRNE